GVVVMNTPFGNSITTAEHAIALMFALARQLPEADASTQQGKWEKNRFMGVEVTGKTLGLIGCGNIGSIVAARALGLRMKVAAFDPFLTPERAVELGVDKVELDELLRRADFITLHTPLTDQTRNILSRENLAKTKKGVRIINCARGGLIDEQALKEALDAGQVAGAALDVFEKEPATASPLFGTPGFISTPHLGASTSEAQVNVAIQVAEQMSDFLLLGGVTNAINMPSLSAEEAPRLRPYMALAEKLGKLVGQILGEDVRSVSVEVEGAAAQLNQKPITGAVLAGLMGTYSQTVNMVNAPFLAKERGLDVREVRHDREGDYHTLVAVEVGTSQGPRRVAGTLFGNKAPRLVELFGVEIEAELAGTMIYIVNTDTPGFIGKLGTALGEASINIATFNLGRREALGEAVALVAVDGDVPAAIVKKLCKLQGVREVVPLRF
ncbi:MAG TPA: phosphoglycerate dehydrogenase, partial [Sphingomicrobium sp.]